MDRGNSNKIREFGPTNVIPPDGGWGWVIVFAVFTGNCLIDGCIGSYGIFYPELLKAFEAGPVVTSMAGSLLPAVFLLTSPLVGNLDRKYGSRPVCFVGGCIGAVGLILASISHNMAIFMITFGVILGVGISMNFLPGHVITNHYFDKKRGIAGGIVCSGAGFGIFILAPVLQILVTKYGWRGAMLLTAGIFLQLCACSTLMRPLCKRKNIVNHSEESEDYEYDPTVTNNRLKEVIIVDETDVKYDADDSKTEVQENDEKLFMHSRQDNIRPCVSLVKSDRSASYDTIAISQKLLNQKYEQEMVLRSLQNIPVYRISKMESVLRNSQFLDPVAVIALSQRINNETELSVSSDSEIDRDQVKRQRSRFCSAISCDITILRNKTFILLLLGGVLIQMGQFIPNMFIPEYCFSIGLDGTQMSIVMALYGAFNILGRLSAGCLANLRHIDALWLCNMGVFMCGVGCVVFSLCTTFESLCIYAIGMGYFIGYFPPLQIIVMIDCLGVDKLTSSLGFLNMAKGPAALIGPPLAGLVYQYSQDYAMSLGFAGLLFLLAAGIQSLIPISKMCSQNEKKRKRNTDVEIYVN